MLWWKWHDPKLFLCFPFWSRLEECAVVCRQGKWHKTARRMLGNYHPFLTPKKYHLTVSKQKILQRLPWQFFHLGFLSMPQLLWEDHDRSSWLWIASSVHHFISKQMFVCTWWITPHLRTSKCLWGGWIQQPHWEEAAAALCPQVQPTARLGCIPAVGC